jgi:hypothetical protein
MQCEHCLRGDAENCDMPVKYIDKLLEQVEGIYSVTFSGGEPSLATDIIEYFLNKCKENNIYIGAFYIATNGLDISERFVITCLKLYAYSDDKEMCLVHVSNDGYHAYENRYNTELLDGLAFFNRKFKEESSYDFNVLSEGRGKYINNNNPLYIDKIKTIDDFEDANIYLNCKGNIINGCDWSYDSQDEAENILCNVADLSDLLEKLSTFKES